MVPSWLALMVAVAASPACLAAFCSGARVFAEVDQGLLRRAYTPVVGADRRQLEFS